MLCQRIRLPRLEPRTWLRCNLRCSIELRATSALQQLASLPLLPQQTSLAVVAQLGERKTEDLEVPCSIHGRSKWNALFYPKLQYPAEESVVITHWLDEE